MTTPLLKTKLFLPPVQPNLVERLRLIRQLQSGLQAGHSLTLVAAPAGFGKTTAIRSWIDHCGLPAAWLSLEAEDSEPAIFWQYVLAALQTLRAGFGQAYAEALHSPQPGALKPVLVGLVNELASLSVPVMLVLDDYHVIHSREIHDGITFLLDHQPPQLHLVISTRADPQLPLARLRAHRLLSELRAADLRFTLDETRQLLNDLMRLELNSQDIRALENRTEGWIVGLLLAAQSLQGREDRQAFIASFSGSHYFIIEYLVDEVLNRQSVPVRQFLLQTAILARLCGPLCEAVTRDEQASDLLQQLYQRNLFIIPLDDEHTWFRYHHLFQDLLLSMLHKFHAIELIAELYRRASLWYAQDESPDEAIRYALLSGDMQLALSQIEPVAQQTIAHGRLNKFLDWMDKIPEDLLRQRTSLQILNGWANHLHGQYAQGEKILLDTRQNLLSQPDTPENQVLRGELAALLAGIATLKEEPARVFAETQEALNLLPEEHSIARARAQMALGTAYAYESELEKATLSWQQARDLASAEGNLFLAASAVEMLSGLQIYHLGQLRQAANDLHQLIALGTGIDGSLQPFTGTAHLLLAEIYLEWDNLKQAAEYLQLGNDLLKRSGIGYAGMYACCVQARLEQALGNPAGVRQALQEAEQLLDSPLLWHMLIHQMSCQARLNLWLGDDESARQWALGDEALIKRPYKADLPDHLRELQQLALARVSLARGEIEMASEILTALLPQAAEAGRHASVIETTLYLALAAHQVGDTAGALAFLEKCLQLAWPEGYRRLFLDAGEAAFRLFMEARAAGMDERWVDPVLAAFGDSVPERSRLSLADPRRQNLIEPLTQREFEVLRMMCEGYTNQDIAEVCFLSVNTIKKHTSNIYGKLGVRNRAQAVLRARELDLI